jgi:hypothetical protein
MEAGEEAGKSYFRNCCFRALLSQGPPPHFSLIRCQPRNHRPVLNLSEPARGQFDFYYHFSPLQPQPILSSTTSRHLTKMAEVTDNNDHLIHSSDRKHPANLIPELCANFYRLGWVTGTG